MGGKSSFRDGYVLSNTEQNQGNGETRKMNERAEDDEFARDRMHDALVWFGYDLNESLKHQLTCFKATFTN